MTTKEINGAFEEFLFDWNSDEYLLIGSYGSSKSYHAVLKVVMKLLQEKRTCLVIRNVYATLKDSCFSLFNEIIADLGLSGMIRSIKSPLEIHFPNGSQVIFRGGDDKEKLKSINNVSLIFAEEISELPYPVYKELKGRLRHPTLPLHMIMATNPVSKNSWVYTHFFQNPDTERFILDDEEFYGQKGLVVGKTYYHHSTYLDNRFLQQSYCDNLEDMKNYDPDLHQVAALGRFGQLGQTVFNNVHKDSHENVMRAISDMLRPMYKNGLDYGFVTSYNAFVQCAVDHKNKILYIFNEYYNRGESDDELAKALEPYKKEVITADSAEAKSNAYLRQRGFKIIKTKKGAGSVLGGIRKLKRFKKIVISDNCPVCQKDFTTLMFATDRDGNVIEDKFSFDSHVKDAVVYSIEDYDVAVLKGQNAKGF